MTTMFLKGVAGGEAAGGDASPAEAEVVGRTQGEETMRTEAEIKNALNTLLEKFHENEMSPNTGRGYELVKVALGYKIGMLEFVLGEREFEYGPDETI